MIDRASACLSSAMRAVNFPAGMEGFDRANRIRSDMSFRHYDAYLAG